MQVYEVGLTGGIASGKSLVAGRLAELGAIVIDHDELARDAVAPGTPGLAAIANYFGPSVLRDDGSLDRSKLAQLVFTDAHELQVLNGIVHPRVHEAGQQRATAAAPGSIVVQMIPLLVETGQAKNFAELIVVDAPEEQQLQRLMERSGLSQAAARARIAAQTTREERLAVADHVIDNSGPAADTLAQVDKLWAGLQQRAQTNA